MAPVLAYFLIGCGTAGISVLSAGAVPLQGSVHGAQQALIGASLQLYAAGTSGDGSPSTPLLSQAVTTDDHGAFSIPARYSCPSAASQLYLVATGGNPGATTKPNPAIALIAALGECGSLPSSPQITVNEATTVASLWPLASFVHSPTEIGSAVSDASQFGAGVQAAKELADMQTGTSPGTPLVQNDVVPVAKLYSLANTLGACVNSTGGVAGDGTACGRLFSSATPAGGSPPRDTFTAALNIARNPAQNVDQIYNLSPAFATFQPFLSASPPDWTLPVLSPPAPPAIAPAGGTYSSIPSVSISDATAGAAIYYTTDGTAPSPASSPYSGPIAIPQSAILRAISVKEGIESASAAASFTIDAVSSPSVSNFQSPASPVATYYVDNVSGSDTNSGSSPSAPLSTIAKVNSLKLTGGQTIAFKSGDEWHEQLNVSQSGTQGAPITYTSYGNGTQPILSAADGVAGWTRGSGVAAQETCSAPAVCSGFEAPAFADWTRAADYGDTTVTISTAQSHHGGSSMALSSTRGLDTRGWVSRSIPAVGNNSTLALRWYFLAPGGSMKPNSSIKTLCLLSGGNQVGFATLTTNSSGTPNSIDFYDTANSIRVLNATPLAGWIAGGWNEIEIDIAVSSTTGGGTLFVNGKQLSRNSNLDTHAEANIDTISLGNVGFGDGIAAGGTLYFDDFKSATSANVGPFNAGVPSTVWYRAQATDPRLINFRGQAGSPTYAVDGITQPNQFYWDGAKLYVYSQSDPTPVVEVPQRSYALASSGASYISVSGLELRGAQQSDLYCTNTCSNWLIENNTINDSYSTALFFEVDGDSSVAGVSILNNKVKGSGAGGIQINNGLGLVKIVGNEISDFAKIFNPAYGTQNAYADGIEMYSQDGLQGFAYVAYNSIHDGGVGSSQSYGGGIHADSVAGMDIEHNVVQNVNSSGIQMEKGSGSIARYNTIIHSGTYPYAAGLFIRAGEGLSVSNMTAEYNTVIGGWWACNLGITQDDAWVTATNITIRKNICVDASAGTQFNADVGSNGPGNTVQGNSFGTPGNSFIYFNGTPVSTYAGFDAAAGYATGSVEGAPQFVDPGSGNFTLMSSSPVSGIGAFP